MTVDITQLSYQDFFSEEIDKAMIGAGFDMSDPYAIALGDCAGEVSLDDVAEAMWAIGNCAMACEEDTK